MKKKYLIVSLVQVIVASALLFPVTAHSQDITEEQKKERCQNNKNRIVELESQLSVINADLSASMTKEEMEDARTQMTFVRSMKNSKNFRIVKKWNRFHQIAAQYKFNDEKCYFFESDIIACANELEKIIGSKIDKAESLDRPALLAKKNEIDEQLASHKINLIALRCDEPADKEKTADISGKWNALGLVYTITQSGLTFNWKRDPDDINELGTGKILAGNQVEATWTNTRYTANATGTVIFDENGVAKRIDWTNGVVFTRKPD